MGGTVEGSGAAEVGALDATRMGSVAGVDGLESQWTPGLAIRRNTMLDAIEDDVVQK